MEPSPDFRELLGLLNSNHVEYLVVGGYALAWHGAPRFTGDIDIYVRPTPENSARVVKALEQFGFASLGLQPDSFGQPNRMLQMGVPPVRVDILTSIDGVTWEEAQAGREPGTCGDVQVAYIGKAQFIANKRSTGRLKDLADVEALGG